MLGETPLPQWDRGTYLNLVQPFLLRDLGPAAAGVATTPPLFTEIKFKRKFYSSSYINLQRTTKRMDR